MTQRLEKKLAVYKMCNETLFYTKHSLHELDGETDGIVLRQDDHNDDEGYSLRKKRRSKNEAPSNKLRRMIIDDAKELKEMYGKPHEQQETLDNISKWLDQESKKQGYVDKAEYAKYKNIRGFGDQLPRNSSVFLTH